MLVDLGHLGLDEGAHLIVKHALEPLEPGAAIDVCGTHPELRVHLRAWARARGHRYDDRETDGAVARITRGTAAGAARRNSEPAGHASPAVEGAIVDHPPGHWGVAPRGAQVELGGPDPFFALDERRACGPTTRRASTRKRLRVSGIPLPRSTGRRRSSTTNSSRRRSSR